MKSFDHPIFLESLEFIQEKLGSTGLGSLEEQVLERLIHTSGDFAIQSLLKFSDKACNQGSHALQQGAEILVDTSMTAAGVHPMAKRTLQTPVHCLLDWAPKSVEGRETRTAIGLRNAWAKLSDTPYPPIVLIGSSPTALEALLDLVLEGFSAPSLIIGMPVGFIGVQRSKNRLAGLDLPQIRIEGSRGGSALAAATVNALLRASVISC